MWYRTYLHFVTIHVFVRRTVGHTDGRTDSILMARPDRLHSMQRCKKRNAITDMTDCSMLLFGLSFLKHYATTTLEAKV